jgi:hypothetical protein
MIPMPPEFWREQEEAQKAAKEAEAAARQAAQAAAAPPAPSPPPAPPAIPGVEDAAAAQAILDAVRAAGRRMSLGEIIGAVSGFDRSTVKVVVGQLVRAGWLVRNATGLYDVPAGQ